jgi:ATP-dependent RNA helicase SUPV3L1/SUV3
MLAREAYAKLCAQIGDENVGLITGEEEINASAPVICCTAEMAPTSGSHLVLDEAHWAADVERGHAWTKLLVSGSYETIEVAASLGARKFLEAVFSDVPAVRTVMHARLSPLAYSGAVALSDIPARSLVVAFSRKAVHSLARRLLDDGRTVGVLYGALPPETRVAQIEKFMTGEVELLVVTDVVGHGINTPAEVVVIAQTDKFDGAQMRDLLVWETAQISGRAGRYGFSGAGKVFMLDAEPGFRPKEGLVTSGSLAAAGLEPDGLNIERGLLRPTYADLGSPHGHQIGVAVTEWSRLAESELTATPGVEGVPIAPVLLRWTQAGDALGLRVIGQGLTRPWPFDGDVAWKILTTPVNAESPVFAALIETLATRRDALTVVLDKALRDASSTLENAESSAGVARDLMVVARLFPEVNEHLGAGAQQVEAKATLTIARRLTEALRSSSHGLCDSCGVKCAPHLVVCDRCHSGGLN